MAQDLVQLAKAEYDGLLKQLEEKEAEITEIKKKLHPLGVFLKETGILEKETRKRK
jgi:hypothetical protein